MSQETSTVATQHIRKPAPLPMHAPCDTRTTTLVTSSRATWRRTSTCVAANASRRTALPKPCLQRILGAPSTPSPGLGSHCQAAYGACHSQLPASVHVLHAAGIPLCSFCTSATTSHWCIYCWFKQPKYRGWAVARHRHCTCQTGPTQYHPHHMHSTASMRRLNSPKL
jgi:hypothetical protein